MISYPLLLRFVFAALQQSGSSEAENVSIKCHRGLVVRAGSLSPLKTHSGQPGISLQIAEGLTSKNILA